MKLLSKKGKGRESLKINSERESRGFYISFHGLRASASLLSFGFGFPLRRLSYLLAGRALAKACLSLVARK
jgi:hypothetical protein